MVTPSAHSTVAVRGVPALPKVQPSSGSTSAPPWSVHTRRSAAVKPQPPYRAACEHSRHLVTGFKSDPPNTRRPDWPWRVGAASRRPRVAVPVSRSLRAYYGFIVAGASQQAKRPAEAGLGRMLEHAIQRIRYCLRCNVCGEGLYLGPSFAQRRVGGYVLKPVERYGRA